MNEKACKHLAKANWDNLQQLSLSNNFFIEGQNPIVNNVGFKYLSKAKWNSL